MIYLFGLKGYNGPPANWKTCPAGRFELNRAALQFGGGVYIKSKFPILAFRAELRDFVSGQPDFLIVTVAPPRSRMVSSTRHSVLAGGGVAVHF